MASQLSTDHAQTTGIYVNLPVKDLKKSIEFFKRMGFGFNPQFTDKDSTCMIIGKNIFAMLLVRKFFKTFIKKRISDARTSTEVLLALSVRSRRQVDRMVTLAIAAGGKEPRAPQDHGWMYSRSFQDLDGHIWEVFFMDMKKMPNGTMEKA